MPRPSLAIALLLAVGGVVLGWTAALASSGGSGRATLAAALGAAGLAVLAWATHQGHPDPTAFAVHRAARRLGLPRRGSRPRGVLLLGPTGAGKTTLVRAHGSVRRLDDAGAPLEGPTDACAFVRADDLVLVDTPGRWLDGDTSDEAEARRLLRRLRLDPRLPWVEALLLAVPLPALLPPDERDRTDVVARWAERVARFATALGRRPPVHVVLTHADALSGFGVLAGALPPNHRARPLGRVLRPDPDGPRREVSRAVAELCRALDRATREILADVPGEAERAALLSLSAEIASVEAPLAALLGASQTACVPAGVWLSGSATPGFLAPVGSRVSEALGVEPVLPLGRGPVASAAEVPAFARGLFPAASSVGRGRPRPVAPDLVALALVLAVGGLGLFGLARHELRHLDALRGGLRAVVEARGRPDAEAWSLRTHGAATLARALHGHALEQRRAAELPHTPPRVALAAAVVPFASSAADEAASEVLRRLLDGPILGPLQAELVSRGRTAAAVLASVPPAADRLDGRQVEALHVASDLLAVGRSLHGPYDGSGGCVLPSRATAAARLVALRPTGDARVDLDLALALAPRLGRDTADPTLVATLRGVEEALARLPPDLRAFSARLAEVTEAVLAPAAGRGLDASTWPAEALGWRPAGLDGPGCLAFHAAPAGDVCATADAAPEAVAARYADWHREQWRRWLARLRVADVRDVPEESTADLAAAIRRVLGPGGELETALSRAGTGSPAASCGEVPDDACCACACLAAEWSLAHQMGAGDAEAWVVLRTAADRLAAAVDALDGASATRLVAETARGEGPLLAFHEAARRVITAIVPTSPTPEGCTCAAASHPLVEAEVRARVEDVTTALLGRAWWQVLRRLDAHLHRRWQETVLAAWAPLADRFPFAPDAREDAAPRDVVAFLGCGGTLDAFLAAEVRPLAEAPPPRWGRAATLAWSPAARSLLATAGTLCRRVDAIDDPRTVQLGLRYAPEPGQDDVVGLHVTVDGRVATYQFGRPLDPLPVRRDTRIEVALLRGNPPRVQCPRYAATAGDWSSWRLLARPVVTGVGARPPYDRSGLGFVPPADLERCGGRTLGGHHLTYREEADGPAAMLHALSTLLVPARLFEVRLPD